VLTALHALLACRPYIIDLESTNGTFINGAKLKTSRFYELKEKDCIKFGNSTRDYILLHDRSV
jgi:smad nuclear-interacting protein 1